MFPKRYPIPSENGLSGAPECACPRAQHRRKLGRLPINATHSEFRKSLRPRTGALRLGCGSGLRRSVRVCSLGRYLSRNVWSASSLPGAFALPRLWRDINVSSPTRKALGFSRRLNRARPKAALFIAHLIAHLIECSGFAFSIKWRIKWAMKRGKTAALGNRAGLSPIPPFCDAVRRIIFRAWSFVMRAAEGISLRVCLWRRSAPACRTCPLPGFGRSSNNRRGFLFAL